MENGVGTGVQTAAKEGQTAARPGRWSRPAGYGEVLRLAVPMILSMGSWSLMHFVDRVFLAWYSPDALAAALPSGMLNFALGTFFFGTTSYVNTFVAQYTGAGRSDRVGASVWQGIHFGVGSGILLLGLIPAAPALFGWVGHDARLLDLEVTYFQILCVGWVPSLVGSAVGAFFSGRGDTKTVMWVNCGASAANVALDYALIFGSFGAPEMGMAGAAWATVASQFLGCVAILALFLRREHREAFHTLSAWRPDRGLFVRMMRFGSPNGVQFFVEIAGFSLFVLLIGRLGTVELAATNLAFNINTLAFLPMIGLGIAVSTLVGQYLGKDDPDLAERTTWSGIHVSLIYMGAMSAAYVFVPDVFLTPYVAVGDAQALAPAIDVARTLLRFVALYSLFDAIYIIFSAAVKGAGDTRFVMWVTIVLSWTVMVVPVYLAIDVFGRGIYAAWYFASAYIILIGAVFAFRFRGGKWRSMRVIEPDVHPGLETMREPDVHTV